MEHSRKSDFVTFNLGKPILVMIVLALLSGVLALRQRSARERADLVVWCFSDSHLRAFKGDGTKREIPSPVEVFQNETGKTVDVQLIANRALNLRMASIFMSNISNEVVPDLVTIEIGHVGKFFRPPVDQIGFLPLNDLLKKHGWYDRLIEARFAPWSKDGVIFGVPNDVHPVSLTYRDDLFREAGIDLSTVRTWDEFHTAGLKLQAYWRDRGVRDRYAIELNESGGGWIVCMLLQRGVNVVDGNGKIYLDDPRVLDTVLHYVGMLAGPRRIATAGSAGEMAYSHDFPKGLFCAMITPDWRARNVKLYGQQVFGKYRMMPLPRFDPSDSPTSTWGGTMLGIPRQTRDPEMAWKLLETLYLRDEGIASAQRMANLLPPRKDYWNHPSFHEPDPFYGGQRVGSLYVELAHQIPHRNVSPATNLAETALSFAVTQTLSEARSNGMENLEEYCRQLLNDAARDIEARVRHGGMD